MRFAPRASNGPNYLGLCALQSRERKATLIKKYYFQLTQGCAIAGSCDNVLCRGNPDSLVSTGALTLSNNDAALLAVRLAQQKVQYLCAGCPGPESEPNPRSSPPPNPSSQPPAQVFSGAGGVLAGAGRCTNAGVCLPIAVPDSMKTILPAGVQGALAALRSMQQI